MQPSMVKEKINLVLYFLDSLTHEILIWKHIQIERVDDNKYLDMPINSELIDYIVLGPCFSEKDRRSIEMLTAPKITFDRLEQKRSIGTGIITMR